MPYNAKQGLQAVQRRI